MKALSVTIEMKAIGGVLSFGAVYFVVQDGSVVHSFLQLYLRYIYSK